MVAREQPPFREQLRRRLAVARGDEPADLVIRGGRVFSVFTGELLDADVAISGQHVAGVGPYDDGQETVDASGLVLLPGFIDGHMHIESTKLMVDEFARVALPWGTTTVVLDPHEIANVFGLDGVRVILASADLVPLDYYVMVSSCVPASSFESSAYTVTADDIAQFLREEPRALGVAEMMNFRSVVQGDDEALSKLEAAQLAGGGHVDGHAPGLSGRELNAYLAAGVRSDHECTSYEEALEKRRLGMWIMIREGSAARNLEALLPVVLEHGTANCMLCTDDREPDQLLHEGHINDVVRKAVGLGCPPADAVVMGTLNAARYHRLHEHGAVAPGYLADVIAVESLEQFRPVKVWKRGRLVAEDGRAIDIPRLEAPEWMRGSVRVPELTAGAFRVKAGGRVRVIGVDPGEIVTRALVLDPARRDGEDVADPGRDLAKAAVIERHRGTGRIGLGFVQGFGLQRGALASTHAHDAHNVVVVGVDDADMAAAVNRLAEIGGGQVAVAGGQVVGEVPCPIGGLMSDRAVEEVAAAVEHMEKAATELGVTMRSPFMAISFLALSVVPELKLTDRGLVDATRFELVPLEA
ncbi:MAG TPA: adenine deaminase [Actinomycetota bacterium]|jgi:adenine deaminase|nr:adenine deaminase [Actinomycetota bacterium]